MHATRSLVGGLLLVLCSASTASAQPPPLTCQSNASVPPQIRLAGLSELTGDFVLVCTGTSPVGGITANITVFTNTGSTSRLIGAATETLALIDEPAPGAQTLGTNLFQGVQSASNAVTFSNIPFGVAAGGPVVNRVVRITNIRVNASAFGFGTPTITATFTSGAGILINNPAQTIAFAQGGTTFAAACGAIPLTMDMRFTELFATAFKVAGGTGQSTPGAIYNTESGFTPNPAIAGVGTASSGTQLGASLSGLAAGVQLSIPASITNAGLTVTAVTPAGGGVVPVVGGAATIAYQVVAANPLAINTITIPVTVSQLPLTGATVRGALYPLSSQTTASASAPIPRFADDSTPMAFGACQTVPTMNEFALLVLALGLVAIGSLMVRRRSAH